MDILNGKRDPALAKKLIAESGYKGGKIVVMIPEVPEYRAMGEVTGAVLQQLGLNVDMQSMDWGTLSAPARCLHGTTRLPASPTSLARVTCSPRTASLVARCRRRCRG